MGQSVQKIIAGNWKMHGLTHEGEDFITQLQKALAPVGDLGADRIILCPPATLLSQMRALLARSGIALGGQNCHAENKGAFTGEISAAMLVDAGCRFVILGHSERRAQFGEGSALIKKKAIHALSAGLTPIICLGETLAEREAGKTETILAEQLSGCLPEEGSPLLAYEPVWAIGSGKSADPEDVDRLHSFLREKAFQLRPDLQEGAGLPILYGGSVTPSNAASFLTKPAIDGALVGGASLDPESFAAIVRASFVSV